MTTTVGGVNIDITVDPSGVARGMDVAKSAVRSGVDSIQGVMDSLKGYLLALGGGLSIAAFANMIKGSIDATAGLHDLSIQTGASVASLAAFRSVASTTSTSVEDIAAAMNKAAKSMAAANEDSKGIGAAVKALGLDFNTLKAMKPEDQMLAVAKAMNEFEDGTGKSAAAMAIYGKEGAKMLPFLKDLADQTGNVTKKLTEQEVEAKRVMAAMADDFGDNLTKIKKDSEAWKKDVAMGMLPALYELSEAFLQVTNGPGGLKAEISQLAADGSITTWTRNAITGLTYVMDAFEGFWVVVKSIALGVGAALATVAQAITTTFNTANQVLHGDFSGALETVKTGFRSVGSIGESVAGDISNAWSQQTLGSKFRDRLGDLQAVGYAAKEAKKNLAFDAAGDAASAAAIDKEAQAYKSLIKAIGEKAAVTALDAKSTEKLTAGQQEAAKIAASLANGTLRLSAAHQAEVEALLDAWIAQEKKNESDAKAEKATLVATEAHWKYLEALDKTLEKTLAEIAAEQERIARLGLSKEAIAELDAAKLRLLATDTELQAIRANDKNLDDAEYSRLMKLAQAYRDQADLKITGVRADTTQREIEAEGAWWKKMYGDVEKSLTDMLSNGFDKGKSFWDSMRDYIVNGAKSMAVKILVQPVMGAISGMLGMGSALAGTAGGDAGGASSLGSLGSLGNMASSVMGGLGAFGTGASYGFQSLFANGLGGTLSAGSSMMGAGSTMAGMGTIAGALAPIALGIAALSKAMAYTVTPTGNALTATVGSGGIVNGTAGTRADFRQEGGLFGGGNTNNATWGIADAGTTSYINAAVQSVTAANAAYANVLGLSASAMDGFTKNLDINVTGMDAAAAKAAINAAAMAFGNDQVAASYGSVIAQFGRVGETASQTLQRLAELTVGMDTLNQFGGIFSKIAAGGIGATDAMASLAGGLDKLIAKSQAFVASYYNDSEQAGIAARGVMAALTAAGISAEMIAGLSSKSDFRALVESIDVTTATGQSQLNALLDIAPQFANLSGALEKQGGSLEGLSELAPQIAALQPTLSQGSAEQQAATAAAANNTQTAIASVTNAVTAGTNAVVSAITGLAGGISSMAESSAASAEALQGRQNQPLLVQIAPQ